MEIKAGLTADELGEQICDYCPLDIKLRGVYSTPGGGSAGCEGSHCSEAYANYDEENNNENVAAPAGLVVQLVMCGRCYAEVTEVFSANCNEKPEELINAPIGMYHCPDCGAMVVAGVEHPPMCKMCIDRKHPGFDT